MIHLNLVNLRLFIHIFALLYIYPSALDLYIFLNQILPSGHRLLLEGYEVTGESREPPSCVGQCKLGAVHYLFHPGHTSAGLCSIVQESPGAGGTKYCHISQME